MLINVYIEHVECWLLANAHKDIMMSSTEWRTYLHTMLCAQLMHFKTWFIENNPYFWVFNIVKNERLRWECNLWKIQYELLKIVEKLLQFSSWSLQKVLYKRMKKSNSLNVLLQNIFTLKTDGKLLFLSFCRFWRHSEGKRIFHIDTW